MFQFTILLMFFWLLWRFNIIFYSRFLFLLMVVFIINGYFRGYGIRVINKWWESTKLLVGCYKGLYWFIGEYHDLHVSWFNLHFVSLNLHVSCFNLHFPCWNLLKSRFFLLKSWSISIFASFSMAISLRQAPAPVRSRSRSVSSAAERVDKPRRYNSRCTAGVRSAGFLSWFTVIVVIKDGWLVDLVGGFKHLRMIFHTIWE